MFVLDPIARPPSVLDPALRLRDFSLFFLAMATAIIFWVPAVVYAPDRYFTTQGNFSRYEAKSTCSLTARKCSTRRAIRQYLA